MNEVTSIQDLREAVERNGEMVVVLKNKNICIMKMEEYISKMMKEDIEKNLLKSEDDILNGRVVDSAVVFEEWKKKYGIQN